MNNLLFIVICYSIAQLAESQCNDWQAYRDLKCFKIFESIGLQNYSDAINICHKQSNDSTLITINTSDEQHFLSTYLFNTSQVVDNVWIGMRHIDSQYRWINGLNIVFTNWEEGYPNNLTDSCVQMHSDFGSVGKWVDESCKRKNLVVCQKPQLWSLSHIQETMINFQEAILKLQETVSTLKQSEASLKENVAKLNQSIVPIGFIYVQLPNEKTPKEIWPWMTWNEITSSYAGLFFRAEGGNSSSFGSTQEARVPRITQVETQLLASHSSAGNTFGLVSVADGGWSKWVATAGYSGEWADIRFFTESSEVRPRNTAIRIWKRYA